MTWEAYEHKLQTTWIHWLYSIGLIPKWVPEHTTVSIFVSLILCATVILASKKLQLRNVGRFQAFMEFIVSSLDGFVHNIVGKESKTLTPIIGSFFIFILCMNLFGLIPGFLSPTANINTTIALALIAFVVVQYYAITRLGAWGYIKHFWGDPWWLGFLMLPIHVIGELAKPLSLAIRLFGNIFGEDMVIAILAFIVLSTMGNILVPMQSGMMLFGIFTGFVQALVFSMLVSIYVAVAIGDHSEEQH